MRQRTFLFWAVIGALAGVFYGDCREAGAAETLYKWEGLQQVKRIAIVAPLFSTDALTRIPTDDSERWYLECLRSLRTTLYTTLPRRLSEDDRFKIAPAALTQRGLSALKWTPKDLFQKRKDEKKNRFPNPLPKRAVALAKRLNVDAALVWAMREPASIKEGVRLHHETWNLNPLNLSIRRIPPHVNSPRIQAALITRQGVVVWRDEQMASHPRTKPATPRTLRADFQDATEIVAQQLAESLLRPPPPAEPKKL